MVAARPLVDPQPVPLARRALAFPLVFAGILAAVSLVPYLLAYLWTPGGHHFAGFFFIADDATTYLAKMRQGLDGAWLWTDPYTSEPHSGVLLFGFYLLLGHLAGLTHLPLIVLYHAARVAGAFALVLALDQLARRTLPFNLRRMGLVIATLGSGLGFLVQLVGNPPVLGIRLQALDLHLPELSGWYSILAIPHFAWATALIVMAFVGLLDLNERSDLFATTPPLASRRPSGPSKTWLLTISTGLTLTALAGIHPQMVFVLGLIWAAFVAVRFAWGHSTSWRCLLLQGSAFALSGPLVAYNAYVLFRDPTIKVWASQWKHQAPDLPSLLVSLGLPIVFASAGIAISWRTRALRKALLVVWPLLVIGLLYLPNLANIQRRLLDAVYVPIGFMAAVGVQWLLQRLGPRAGRRLKALLLPAFCLSSLLVLAISLRFASGAFVEAYVTDENWQAIQWLSSHHSSSDRVASSPQVGLLLPAWSGVPVYVGHYSETLDYFGKISAERAAFSGGPETVRQFLYANRITLLYWGEDERTASSFDPQSEPFLRPVYGRGSTTIYRVIGLD
jgi:hypothetical protein